MSPMVGVLESDSKGIADFLGVKIPESIGTTGPVRYLGQKDMEALMLERPPFFFIERAVAFDTDVVLGVCSIDKERTRGHFPGYPVVPLIELCKAMAQTGIILASLRAKPGKVPIASAAGRSRAFSRDLIPAPARVLTHLTFGGEKFSSVLSNGEAYVDGIKVGALGEIVYTNVDKRLLQCE